MAAVALDKGAAGLAEVELTVLRPIQPMLASTAAGIEEAFAGQADGVATAMSVEAKLDGARIQVHRLGGESASTPATSTTPPSGCPKWWPSPLHFR